VVSNSSRYQRQLNLPHFGQEAQQKLALAKVLVVGAGGLGVPVLQYLAGMGIGHLGIMDGDAVHLTNLHRQVLYTEADVHLPKAQIAAQKLKALNSSISIRPFTEHLNIGNALELIGHYDLVIDATDNFPTRYLINDACVILNKPFVYGAVHQYEGQVSVFNFAGGPTYRCLYPTMPSAGEIPDCNTGGVLGIAPGIVGCHMALETVKVLTNIGENLSGKLLNLDLLNNSQYIFKLKPNPANQHITNLQSSYDDTACSAIPNLSVKELSSWLEGGKPFSLLDLRDEDDFDDEHIDKAQFFTTRSLEHQPDVLPKHQPVVTICYRGHRSLQAAQYLKEKYPGLSIYHVAAGMDGWRAEMGQKHLVYE
jgi:sulfur-carrier protein adenylyltransferase/sulfurtransferase